jgi:hypothetical protein
MSKTTFFKRIALTAIAALGFGMLSVAPSQAVAGVPTVTVAPGSASVTVGSGQETKTAAYVTVEGLLSAKIDSYTITLVRKSGPAATADSAFNFGIYDTVTHVNTRVDDVQGNSFSAIANTSFGVKSAISDSDTVANNTGYTIAPPEASNGYVGAKFFLALDSSTTVTRTVGTYVFTAIVTPFTGGTAGTPVNSADIIFTVDQLASVLAAANGTIDSTRTTAYLGSGTAVPTADGANITAVATSANTTRATLAVRTFTEDGDQAPESVTVTITGAGIVGTSATGVYGKSITVAADGATNFLIRSDGTAGSSSIVVSTPTRTFAAKTMRFYALAASTVEVSVNKPVISTEATEDTVRATFKDASGNVWAGAAYIYASTAADALIAGSVTPSLCTWDSADNRHECSITGSSAGTANFKVIDASTVALATTTSAAVAVRVSNAAPASVTLSFDKATYAPGEKAQLRVLVQDAAGLNLAGQTIASVFAASMTSSKAFGPNSASITSTSAVLSGVTSAAADLNAGHQTYVVYMPSQAGAVTVSAVGGTGLVAAGRVAVSATATVVDTSNDTVIAAADAATDAASEAIDAANAATDAANLAAEAADAATVAAEEARDAADAATAAVEALATEVATLMAALKAQITTLANTVAKIAKKVKA